MAIGCKKLMPILMLIIFIKMIFFQSLLKKLKPIKSTKEKYKKLKNEEKL